MNIHEHDHIKKHIKLCQKHYSAHNALHHLNTLECIALVIYFRRGVADVFLNHSFWMRRNFCIKVPQPSHQEDAILSNDSSIVQAVKKGKMDNVVANSAICCENLESRKFRKSNSQASP